MKNDKLIVGLDIGTTKVCAIVAEAGENSIDIIGFGETHSRGLRKGAITDIEGVVESIKKAKESTQATADIDIKAVYTGIAESSIGSLSSNGVIAVRDKEITQKDIEKVIEAARAIAIPFDREILHMIPTGFTVDGQNGINDPRGMTGVRLEAKVQIVTGALTLVQNLLKSCQMAGLQVIEVVFKPIASAHAVLTEEEKDIGVGIVDIGGGTTAIALFYEGGVCHTSVLTVGGSNFTNDVAIGLRTPPQEAERIKKSYGCAMLSMVDTHEEIEITYEGNKPNRRVPRQHLIEILQPRTEELLILIRDEIRKSGCYSLLASGIVLTGGTALLEGIDVVAENILELPVRIGYPRGIGGNTDIVSSPVYATGVGLVLYGAKEAIEGRTFNGDALKGVMSFPAKMKGWVKKKLGV